MMRKLSLFTILIFFFNGLSAQLPQMKFNYLTTDDGLSTNRASCFYRDSKGYLWIGAENGLNRYDGNQIKIFQTNEKQPGTISNSNIKYIYEDRGKNLWVGTFDGLNLYNPATESFKVFRNDSTDRYSINDNRIDGIIEDKKGNLWILTGGNCLNKWIPKNQNFIRYQFQKTQDVYIPTIKMIAIDSKGFFWIVTPNRGICRFDPETGKNIVYDDPSIDFGIKFTKSICIDKQDKIWFGSNGSGFYSFDPVKGKFEHYGTNSKGTGTNGNLVRDIIEENDRYLLIALDQGGINRFDKVTKMFEYIIYDVKNRQGLNNDGVWCIYKDREGILWVGTSGGGVNFYNPKLYKFNLFTHFNDSPNSLAYDVVGCFHEDSQGMIWIGTDGGGISVYNPKTGIFKNYKHNPSDPHSISGNFIRCIAEDKDHDLWIGTWDSGLNRFDRKTGQFYHYLPDKNNPSSVSSKITWHLIVDHLGKIWLTSWGNGIEVLDPKKGVIKRFRLNPDKPGSLSNNAIWFLNEDDQGNIWACADDALNLYDRIHNSFTVFKNFPDNHIRVICQDKKGNLWAGSISKGLFLFKPDGTIVKTYDKTSGLPDNSIYAIVEDNQGNLWITTSGGISQFNPETQKFRNYNKSDGLQGDQFFQQSFLKTRNGDIYFGGFKGFNSFSPGSLKDNDYIPPVYITDFQIFNKPVVYAVPGSQFQTHINEAKEIDLSWDQSVFSFEFAAINFTHPEKNQYSYIMEGFEKEWNYTNASRRYATYTNLDPGIYTFKVKASNNDGVWNEQGTSIKIIILSPWWQTLWFKFILLAVIAIVAFWVYKWRAQVRDFTEQKRMDVALRKERNLLRTLIDHIPDAIYVKDTNCRKTIANLADVRNTGLHSEAEVLGKNDFELFPKELAEGFFIDDQSVIKTGQPVLNREEYVFDEEGRKRWLLTSKIPLRDEKGQIFGLVGMGYNITQRKLMEEQLSKSEAKTRLILENAFDGFSFYEESLIDKKRRLVDCNRRYAEMAGRTKEELLRIGDTFPLQNTLEGTQDPSAWEIAGDTESETIREGKNHRGLFSWIRPDGKENYIEYSAVPVIIDGKVFTIGLDRDVTERILAEQRLRNEQILLRTLIDNLPDAVYVKDKEYRKVLVNPADIRHLGCTSEVEVLGKNDFDIYPKEMAEGFYADDQSVIQTGQPVLDKEEYVLDEEGQKCWLLTSKLPLRNQDGEIIGLLGIGRDITKRKLAEEELRKSEENFKRMAANIEDIIYSVDADTTEYRYLSPAFQRILGYTEQDIFEMGGRRLFLSKIIFEEKFMRQEEIFDDIRSHGRSSGPEYYEAWWRCKDGSMKCLEDHWIPVFEGGRLVSTDGILRDITEWKKANEELLKSEENFQRMASRIDETLYSIDVYKKEFLYLSPVFEQTFGYSVENIGMMGGLRSFFSIVTPDQDFAPLQDLIEDGSEVRLQDVSHHQTAWWRCKDGSLKYIENRWFTQYEGNRRSRIDGVLRDMTEQQQLEEQRRLSEEKLKVRNIELEHMLTDLQEMQEKALRAQNLAAVTRLTAGIADEINAPLTTLENTMRDPGLDPETKKSPRFLGQIGREIQNIKSVIDRLRRFSQTDPDAGIDLLKALNDAFPPSSEASKPKITVLKKG